MNNNIIDVINELCNKFGIAIDWTSNNVAPYIQTLIDKYARYRLGTSITWLVFGLVIMVIAIFFFKYAKQCEEFDNDWGLAMIFGLSTNSIAIIMIIKQIHNILACVTFPEYMFIQMLTNLK